MRAHCHGICGENAGPRNWENCFPGLDLSFRCVSSEKALAALRTSEPVTWGQVPALLSSFHVDFPVWMFVGGDRSSTGAPSRCTTVRNQREVSKAKWLRARRLRTVVYSCPLSHLAAYHWAMATSKMLQNTVTARYPRGNRLQDHLWIPNPQQYQYYWPLPSVDPASSDSTDQRMVESMDAEPTDTESRVVQALESNHLVEY